MSMKKLIFAFLICVAFNFTMRSQTVYVTESGKKFHKKNCDLAKTGKKGIELKDAKKQGYEACKSCKPEEAIEPKKEKEKPKTTK
jgi:methylphosphotriester-DNA--protein-cysteine methyltransferase